MEQFLAWLTALPPGALYVILALTAAIENVFPPFPADTVVAFGSFLAARGDGTAFGVFLSTWIGNLAGAMGMYATGRRLGAQWLAARVAHHERAGGRLWRLYNRFGLAALFLSRFLPGVRALVPPFAGATRVPAWEAAAIMGLASGIWYGLLTYVSYSVGADWEDVQRNIISGEHTLVLGAAALVTVAVIVVLVRRSRR